jgi:tRNA(Ile)-lysidine synthase
VRGARPEREIERAIETGGIVSRGESVLVACSGGPDSVALAAALNAVAQPMALTLGLAYVNHGVRPSAWQDECVVLEVAARYELPLQILSLAEAPARDEQGMRAARYAKLAEAARRQGCGLVATAHHAEDQSETVLLALLRGAGPDGLRGMRARRPLDAGVELARPLIGVASQELRAYCHARALPYAVDPTNADSARRRNAVREALAALRPLFPGLDEAVARAASLLSDERDQTERAHLRRALRRRLADEVELRDIDFEHVEAAVRALEEGRTGVFYMKPGVALRIEGHGIGGMKRS